MPESQDFWPMRMVGKLIHYERGMSGRLLVRAAMLCGLILGIAGAAGAQTTPAAGEAAAPAAPVIHGESTPPRKKPAPDTKTDKKHDKKHKKEASGPRTPTAQDAADAVAAEAAARARAEAEKKAAERAAALAAQRAAAAAQAEAIKAGKIKPPPNVGTKTGAPLPRYAALKSDRVNMRVGPGMKYPVLWEYRRAGLPVRILREFDIWRLIEDMDGVKGWVQSGTLTGRRNFVVTSTEPVMLRADASEAAEPVASMMPGVVGRIKACAAQAEWCEVQSSGYKGYLPRRAFWGSDPGEAVQP